MSFACVRCGRCCRWPGCVKVSEAECETIAAYMHMPFAEFMEVFTALRPDRTGLTLIERADGGCIFLEDGPPSRCRINPVKPEQCRGFPHSWNFPGWQKECPGAGRPG